MLNFHDDHEPGGVIRTYSPETTDDDAGGWFAMIAGCQWCGYEWSAVFPLGTDESTLECPQCHQRFSVTREVQQ